MTTATDNRFSAPRGLAWLRQRHQLLHGGPDITCTRTSAGIWRLTHDLPLATAEHAIDAHADNVRQERNLYKNDIKRRISHVLVDDTDLIVKEYRHIYWLYCCSLDYRSWLCTNRLKGCVPAWGWFRTKSNSTAYIIQPYAGPCSLNLMKQEFDVDWAIDEYIRALRLIVMLHDQNIFHTDLKPHNFVAARPAPERSEISLIDCDDVRFPHRLSRSYKVRNLAQFFGGLAYSVSWQEPRRQMATALKEEYIRLTNQPPFTSDERPAVKDIIGKLYPKYLANYLDIEDIVFL